MKVIIVGAGRTGRSLVEALAKKNYDITIIDKQKNLVDDITDSYNVSGVVGSGASKDTLMKAGADTADVLIALTPVDEINLLSCMQAKALGAVGFTCNHWLKAFDWAKEIGGITLVK